MQKKLKSSFFDHLWLKLFALIIAFLLWFSVMNIEDATMAKTIGGIEVEMLNGDTILESGGVYDVTEGDTVEIIVKGPRSIVENLEAGNFTATADLSHLSVTNSTSIEVVTNDSISEKVARQLTITPVNEYVTLSIEEETEKSIPVKVITTGNAKSGFALGSAAPTPNMITVTGPESVLSNIVEARAVVDVTNAEADIEDTVKVGCIDGYGSAVQKDNVKLSDDKITVNIPVYHTKTIPVNVNTVGTPKEGFGVHAINYEPTTILIAGTDEALDAVTSLTISDISRSDADGVIEKNVALQEYLPSEIQVADSTTEIAVSVQVEAISQRELTLSTSNIKIIGSDDKYEYEFDDSQNLKIKVAGFAEDLADINIDSLNPRISVQDLGTGDHELEVIFDESEKFKIDERYFVILKIKEAG